MYLLFFSLSIWVSCSEKKNDSTYYKFDKYPRIEFNENLKLLIEGELCDFDFSNLTFLNKAKIISIVDGFCMKCVINEINQRDILLQEITKNDSLGQVIFIMNVSKEGSVMFLKHFEPLINVKGLILWDDEYNFENKNNLLTSDKKLRTFLIDHNNQIKIMGDPIYNTDLIKEYKMILQEINLSYYN
ncbi:hypothetical protein Belba_0179 [Belliella baltica DSM 15883]|uniref:Thioredoxin domain-containing protein n=1 Tax=Belliella baltica (strain DSM 15883 / CIP 108006 / LMG 21964 / BA134) TaxID=866536 RepID=I3Z0T0_BELBD|nr:hypothetical protein [Belliella baltica]AFL82848.1 hypothetical protein Belba_0179 [Belliella baltica DSM 15883]